MDDIGLVVSLALILAVLFAWAFRHLPQERFQVLAAVPMRGIGEGRYKGANLTWYGFFSATGYALGAAVFFFLVGAVGAQRSLAVVFGLVVVVLGMVAARGVARLVEGKRYGLTVGGASFVVLLAAPVAVSVVAWVAGGPERLPAVPALAALAIGYAFGEGVGRLACISFGCCYGRPVSELGSFARRLFARLHFTFSGPTKKIAYASGLEGVAVVPVQALTAVVLVGLGLAGTLLYLSERYAAAFLLAVAGSQGWRAFSEVLRADDRGGARRLSAYQAMALAAIPVGLAVLVLLPGGPSPWAEVASGLEALWHPAMILLLELLWAAAFLYTGVSRVTGSLLRFRVYRSRV
jgi:hypothetical protein